MKTKSKALLLTLCAVLLVTASVLGTMAFLTSNDEVVNTFSVGSVAIKLDEAKANTDGSLVEGAARVKACLLYTSRGRYLCHPVGSASWLPARADRCLPFYHHRFSYYTERTSTNQDYKEDDYGT